MLNRKTPETLSSELTIKAPGDTFKVPVIFRNRSQSEINAFNDKLKESEQGKDDVEWLNREMFIFIVEQIDGETPSQESLEDAENRFPGFIAGVFFAFHQLRQVSVAKN